MKKFYLIVGALIGGLAVNAQISTSNSATAINNRNTVRPVSKANSNSAKVEGQLWWNNAFDIPSEWTQTTGTGHTSGDWAIITSLPANITAQQASYDWPATFSGAAGNYAFINSDDAGNTETQDAYFEYTGSIDMSAAGSAAMYLTFAEYYRHYYEDNFVEVSNDNGATWTIFAVNPVSEVPVNTNCVPGEVEVVNITPAIALTGSWGTQVKIRFHYVGAWDWFWGIDDVKIVEAWNNDIKINNWYQATDIATTQGLDYYNIPQSQTSFPGLTFGAKVTNNGGLNQTSVALTATATGGYNQTGNSLAIAATMSDTVSITTPYIPSGLGIKTIDITTTIAGVDGNPTNNMATFDLVMDTYQYGRDNGISTGGVSQINGNDGLPMSIGNVMEIFDDMTVTNIALSLADQNAGTVGSEYFAQIYKYNMIDAIWEFFASSVIANVTSTAGGWKTLLIEGGPVVLSAGDVVLVVAGHFGGTTAAPEVRFDMAQNTVEGTVQGFLDSDPAGFSLTSPGAIMIRLSEDPSAIVSEIENNLGMSVYPNPTSTSATVAFALSNESAVTLSVTDLSGKVVFSNALGTVIGAQKVTVNTDSLTSGVYMVNVSVDGTVSTQKLIVRK